MDNEIMEPKWEELDTCKTCGKPIQDKSDCPRSIVGYNEETNQFIAGYEHMECFTERRKKERAYREYVEGQIRLSRLIVLICVITIAVSIIVNLFV